VRKTGIPVRITRFGRPVAEVVPAGPIKKASGLGCLKGTAEISGDIVGPVGAFGGWTVGRK